MTNGGSNRGSELEIIRQLLIVTANKSQSNEQAIEKLTERLDRQTVNIDRLEVKVEQIADRMDQFAERMDQFSDRMDQFAERMDQFSDRMDQFTADADADRTVMMVMMERMDAIQQDNHRIWQYLLSRERNGNSN